MRIALFIKQVPDVARIELDPETGTLRREGARAIMNPWDRVALDAALELRARFNAEITAFTMGPPHAEAVLKTALAAGAHRALLLTDRAFAGSDTFATANILAAAARHAGPFDLLLFGKHATDGDTGHVGPETAALLGLPSISNVADVTACHENTLRVVAEVEGGHAHLRVKLPCALCVADWRPLPRMADMAGMLANKSVQLLDSKSLHFTPPASLTRVAATWTPEPRRSCAFCNVAQLAEKIMDYARGTADNVATTPWQAAPLATETPVFVFAERLRNNAFAPVALELLAAARSLGRATAVVFGADGIEQLPVENIIVAEGHLLPRDETHCAAALANIFEHFKPACVLFGGTLLGRAIAPRVAALLKTGLTADCTALEIDAAGNLLQTRPAFGGRMMARILTPNARPQIATVRPGVLRSPNLPPPARQNITRFILEKSETPAVVEEAFEPAAQTRGLADARIVVAGGRGMGSKNEFQMLEELARALNAEVGASRGAVETGWRAATSQVGQTGATIAPALYIACGISGQIQHLAGITHAARVVAINTDPDAEIFGVADAGIIGDAREIIPELLARLKNKMYSIL